MRHTAWGCSTPAKAIQPTKTLRVIVQALISRKSSTLVPHCLPGRFFSPMSLHSSFFSSFFILLTFESPLLPFVLDLFEFSLFAALLKDTSSNFKACRSQTMQAWARKYWSKFTLFKWIVASRIDESTSKGTNNQYCAWHSRSGSRNALQTRGGATKNYSTGRNK